MPGIGRRLDATFGLKEWQLLCEITFDQWLFIGSLRRREVVEETFLSLYPLNFRYTPLYIGLATGYCGSVTTFSSWMLQVFQAFGDQEHFHRGGLHNVSCHYAFPLLPFPLVFPLHFPPSLSLPLTPSSSFTFTTCLISNR